MQEIQTTAIRTFPEKLTAHWKRFSNGLWRVPVGDISAAYCADIFPKLKTFSHEGSLYANLGANFSSALVHVVVNAYPLLTPGDGTRLEPQANSYQGRDGTYRGKKFWMGPKVDFETTDPTVQEWRDLLRAAYADGGCFANQSTYADFLARYAGEKANLKLAWLLEMEHELRFKSKAEMSSFLDAGEAPVSGISQMNLGF